MKKVLLQKSPRSTPNFLPNLTKPNLTTLASQSYVLYALCQQ